MELINTQLTKLLKGTERTARAAGQLLLKSFHSRRKVSYKGKIDLVTEMDIKSEKLIVRQLSALLPEATFLTEEESVAQHDSELKWIIDPLDGTTNYAHTFPVWCVSIALEYRDKIVLGVVFDPTRDEMFTAARGVHSRLNGKNIHVTERKELSHCLLATGFPYDIRTSSINNLRNFANFVKSARAVRRAGSAALDLCYVAAGRFDGFWELKLHAWDTAAGILIVEQAGGKVSDFKGGEFSIYNDRLIASNGHIHQQMQAVLRKKKWM